MNRIVRDLKELATTHKEKLPYLGVLLLVATVYIFSKARDSTTYVYRNESKMEFKDGKILGSQGQSLYEGKERLFLKTVHDIQSTQQSLKEATDRLQARMDEIDKAKGGSTKPPGSSETYGPPDPNSPGNAGKSGLLEKDPIRVAPPPEDYSVTQARAYTAPDYLAPPRMPRAPKIRDGNSIISFPVKEVALDKSESIVLPVGSYVRAKLMTGVEAPEGRTYPVLLQLDYAYIVANKHRIDLSGCFMIAKSQGDLSTERVQMQADKLSCVSKEGRMFERDVNGFIADDKDNSFAVIGSVNSKQDRVAAMAFLTSIVEGVGKALQQAQTTQQTNPLGGTQSIITGDQAAYIGAGGASNAATMVSQWYLKQAQNLLPTINVGSGQDVWVIMKETVKLPNDYFQKSNKGGQGENVFTYFSRIGS